MHKGIGVGVGMMLLAGAAIAQQVDDKHPFKPGDILSLGPDAYPAGATYRVVDCDPVDKRYRECRVIRSGESHARPLVMENYVRHLEIVGHAGAPAVTAAARPGTAAPRPVAAPPQAAPAAAAAGGKVCPKSAYGGPVPGTTPASAALFRQKITDSITMGSYGRGWYGVILADFKVGSPVRNGVGQLPGGGASRVNNGAPVGATMYPVSTTMTVCEGWPSGSGSWRTSAKKYLCFVSANREWTCGASN